MDKLSVGRIVHYVSHGTPNGEYESACRAAVVTAIDSRPNRGDAELCVLNPTGIFFNRCSHSEEHIGGTWHWPERT